MLQNFGLEQIGVNGVDLDGSHGGSIWPSGATSFNCGFCFDCVMWRCSHACSFIVDCGKIKSLSVLEN